MIRPETQGNDDFDRLHWQCRRGMLELDELFGRFLKTTYQALAANDKSLFIELLNESDPDLYQWLLVGEHCPSRYEILITRIKESQ